MSYLFAFSYCSWGSQSKNTEWFAIPFSSGPHFVRTLHHDPPILGRTLERICSSFELESGFSPAEAIHLLGSAFLNTMPSWWSSLSSRKWGSCRSPLLWSAGFFPSLGHVWTVWVSLKQMQNFTIENYGWKYLFFILWSPVQRIIVVQLLSQVWLFVRASLSLTISWSSLKLMSIELMILSNHLILCCSLFLLPSIFPSIRVFSNDG